VKAAEAEDLSVACSECVEASGHPLDAEQSFGLGGPWDGWKNGGCELFRSNSFEGVRVWQRRGVREVFFGFEINEGAGNAFLACDTEGSDHGLAGVNGYVGSWRGTLVFLVVAVIL
jgi:hypothetical protein